MLLGVQLTQPFEGGDARVVSDAGVRAAEQHAARAVRHLFELAARLEVAFRPEIFADFTALLHGGQRAPPGQGWAKFRASIRLKLWRNCA